MGAWAATDQQGLANVFTALGLFTGDAPAIGHYDSHTYRLSQQAGTQYEHFTQYRRFVARHECRVSGT